MSFCYLDAMQIEAAGLAKAFRYELETFTETLPVSLNFGKLVLAKASVCCFSLDMQLSVKTYAHKKMEIQI